jgi:hypothetical protein
MKEKRVDLINYVMILVSLVEIVALAAHHEHLEVLTIDCIIIFFVIFNRRWILVIIL